MAPIDQLIRRNDFFLRRRDLLAAGFVDGQIRGALEARQIFRVRHGWYSVPDAPPEAIRAVRVGGRLTSISALLSYGLRVPRRELLHVAVVATACRLRDPDDRWCRLGGGRGAVGVGALGSAGVSRAGVLPSGVHRVAVSPVRVHWVDRPAEGPRRGGTIWRVSLADAVVAVLLSESRDIAVACCSAVLRHRRLSAAQLGEVFRRAPERVRCWQALVSALDDSHGETFARLWMLDAGIRFEQQPHVAGVGRLDFRIGPHSFLEIDGAQHDPRWTGEGESSWSGDLDRGLTLATRGDRVLRVGYRQLYGEWPRIVAAIERAVVDDQALDARRRRHPYRERARRKRRRSAPSESW